MIKTKSKIFINASHIYTFYTIAPTASKQLTTRVSSRISTRILPFWNAGSVAGTVISMTQEKILLVAVGQPWKAPFE